MFDSFRKLSLLLNPREKRSFLILVGLMLIEAALEMAGVAIIPLYITALAYPESVMDSTWTNSLLTAEWRAGLTSERLIIFGSLLVLIFFLAKTAFTTTAVYWKARFAQNRALKLSMRLFAAYLDAPYTFHLQRNASELLRNINNECTQLAIRVLMPMVELISYTTILLGIVTVLVFVLPLKVLTWLVLFLGVGIGSATLMQNRVKRLGIEAQQERAHVVQTVNEGLGGVKEIKLMRRASHFVERLGIALSRILAIQRFTQVLQRAIPSVIELVGIAGLLGVTAMLIVDGSEPQAIVAILSVFAVAITRLKGTVRGVMQAYTDLRHEGVALEVVFNDLRLLEEAQLAARAGSDRSSPLAVDPLPFNRQIELLELGYRYPGSDTEAVHRINLRIRRGEAVGFVGTTGAGKSTLVDLILGVLQPTSGHILVDGVDIQTSLPAWQRNLGYVPQNIFLVDGTVTENIALGVAEEAIDPDRIDQAIQAAELFQLIGRLPQGSETLIGEDGIRLSGGERQRIAVARALYHNPDVLVMDEATSALDNTTEAAVIAALEALKGDRTILMIAHRLSTVRRCDRIIFLKNGAIDAIGTYNELRLEHSDFRVMTEA